MTSECEPPDRQGKSRHNMSPRSSTRSLDKPTTCTSHGNVSPNGSPAGRRSEAAIRPLTSKSTGQTMGITMQRWLAEPVDRPPFSVGAGLAGDGHGQVFEDLQP